MATETAQQSFRTKEIELNFLMLVSVSDKNVYHRIIIEPFELEHTFKGHLVQLSCNEWGHLQLRRLFRACSSLTFNVSRDRHPPPLWATCFSAAPHLGKKTFSLHPI